MFMNIDFIPESRSGKWSVGFGLTLLISVVLSLIFATAIGGDLTVIAASSILVILNVALNLTLNLAALLSLALGIYTIIKHKEWSVCKPLGLCYALTILMFLIGEFAFPH